jgi:hypothetical protein
MTPAILQRAVPYLSIYQDGPPDPRSAEAPVLQAIREAASAVAARPVGGFAGHMRQAAVRATQAAPRVVAITARSAGPDGGRFIRQAIVRLGGGGSAELFQILTWGTEDMPMVPST